MSRSEKILLKDKGLVILGNDATYLNDDFSADHTYAYVCVHTYMYA